MHNAYPHDIELMEGGGGKEDEVKLIQLTIVPAVYPHINKAINNILFCNIVSRPQWTDPQSIDCRISRVKVINCRQSSQKRMRLWI